MTSPESHPCGLHDITVLLATLYIVCYYFPLKVPLVVETLILLLGRVKVISCDDSPNYLDHQ